MAFKDKVLEHSKSTFTGKFYEYQGNLLMQASEVADTFGVARYNASRILNQLVYKGELVRLEALGEAVPTHYGFKPPHRVVYFIHKDNVSKHNALINEAKLAGEWDAKTRVDKAHEYGVHFSILKRPPIKETNKYRLVK